tara:strand:+ start:199 stop:399 length:201 start_codon:yes stop_codon:yes gene_type:complete
MKNKPLDIKLKRIVIDVVNSTTYIWKMHNWSRNYKNTNARKPTARHSCGRPFVPYTCDELSKEKKL